MQKQQREFFLREQLKAIQKELGLAKDDRTAELDKFKARLDQTHADRGGRASASTRKWTSWRCSRPARRNTPSPATIWTG